MDILAQLRTALPDRYEIEREIGRGGMATVYLARDLRHERQVAFKVLNPELGAVLGLERFQAEIKVTANLQHPNLLPLFDSGEVAGLLFYVMPFVSGESLRARLERERQLPVDDALRITISIASALDYAHRNGVIHRDLKPENILLQDGQPVIADFGIALAVSKAGGARVTQTGLSLGTPEYMSPEQATGDRTIDARTDIYSLGAVLYEMLVGEPPHTGASVQAIVARVLTDPVRSVRSSRPTVPEHIDNAIQHALAKLPADRFATAKEFGDALSSPTSAAAIRGTSTGMRRANPGVSSRLLRVWQGLAVLGVLTAIGAFAMLKRPGASDSLQLARQLTFDGTVIGAAISPDGAWLAYVTDDCMGQAQSCTNTLKVREVDGTQSVQIATWPYIRPDVRWSPNGSTLLFAGSADSLSAGLYLTSRLGGSIRRMPIFPSAQAFDGTGKHVVAAVGPEGAQQLVFIDETTLAITDSIKVAPGVTIGSLDFSAHSDAIVVIARFAGVGSGVGLLSRDGALLDSVVMPVRQHVRWSPDGKNLLVFAYGPGISDDLVSIPVAGSTLDVTRLTVALGQVATQYVGKFDVASNGRVVVTSGPTSHSIDLLRAGGSHLWTHTTTRTGYMSAASVSPDGGTVAATATDNLGDNIYAYSLSGGAPRAITAVRGTRQYGAWSASGRRLSYGIFTAGVQAIVATDVSGAGERVIQPGEPANPSMWLGDSNVVIGRRNWFIRYDTLAHKLDSLNIPDSLGLTAGIVGNPASGIAAFWSHRAGAVIIANFAARSFSVRIRSKVYLLPIEVGNDGTVVAIASDRTPSGTVRRFVRISPGAPAPITLADLPPACDDQFSGSGGAVIGCSVSQFRPDVWLADRAGRSRW